jgi:hypothetical protein
MSDANQRHISDQLQKEEILKKLAAEPIAYLRQLGNAHVPQNKKPEAATHMLTWSRGGGLGNKNLYPQEVVDHLLEYILKLEEQLAIDAAMFRQKSINDIIQNHHLDGFTKVQS